MRKQKHLQPIVNYPVTSMPTIDTAFALIGMLSGGGSPRYQPTQTPPRELTDADKAKLQLAKEKRERKAAKRLKSAGGQS